MTDPISFKKRFLQYSRYILCMALICAVPLWWYHRDLAAFGGMAEGWPFFLFKTSVFIGGVGIFFIVFWFLWAPPLVKETPRIHLFAFAFLNTTLLTLFYGLSAYFFHGPMPLEETGLLSLSIFLALCNVLGAHACLYRQTQNKIVNGVVPFLLVAIAFILFLNAHPLIRYVPHAQLLLALGEMGTDAYIPQRRAVFLLINGAYSLFWIICLQLKEKSG